MFMWFNIIHNHCPIITPIKPHENLYETTIFSGFCDTWSFPIHAATPSHPCYNFGVPMIFHSPSSYWATPMVPRRKPMETSTSHHQNLPTDPNLDESRDVGGSLQAAAALAIHL
jgi:hypothetical protein